MNMGENSTRKMKNALHHVLYQDDEDFFEMQPGSDDGFLLSHQTNKSSVLCPESQDITSQYLVLQQLDAHQRMISRAKGTVDNSAPKSMQSYRSVTDRKKKSLWQQQTYQSRASPVVDNASSDLELNRITSAHDDTHIEEDNDDSINASSVNKAVQTGMPFSEFHNKTADKITWYLEALSQGELQSQFFMYNSPQSTSLQSINQSSSNVNSRRKRVVKGDIMEWHKNHFVKSSKSFSPRILANTNAKSKVKNMRCYNPPFRKKKSSSSINSSDTFESYEEDYNEDDFEEEESDDDELEVKEETLPKRPQVRRPTKKVNTSFSTTKDTAQKFNHHPHSDLNPGSDVLNKYEEDKYLNFLSKVTEDILRSGVYTDRAIQRAFEFHMQFHQKDADRGKLQLLLEQVLERLQISTDETGILTGQRFSSLEVLSTSRPSTPPEKENADILSGLTNLLKTSSIESELRESINDEETLISRNHNFSESTAPETANVKQVFQPGLSDS